MTRSTSLCRHGAHRVGRPTLRDDTSASFTVSQSIRRILFLAIALCSACTVGADPHPQAPSQRTHHEFRRVLSGRTATPEGIAVSYSDFESEDGVSVKRELLSYQSIRDARAALGKLTRHASRAVQRGAKNEEHRPDRVVLMRDQAAGKQPETIIAWTDKAKMIVLRSNSLPHVLDFEEQAFPDVPASH